MEAWLISLIGLVVGLLGSAIGIYVGLRVGLVEIKGQIENLHGEVKGQFSYLQKQIDTEMLAIGKIEQWQKDKERFDYEFRHDEYAKSITTINMTLWPLETRMKVLDERLSRVEQVLIEGGRK